MAPEQNNDVMMNDETIRRRRSLYSYDSFF